MHYGASLDLRMDDSPAEFAQFLTDHGLSHVEIRHNYLDARSPTPTADDLAELRDSYDLTYTVHAPYSDCNPGHLNDTLRAAATDSIVDALDLAAAIGAGAVVTHGGAVRRTYPDRVKALAREQALQTVGAAATHAADVGVPLCVENSRQKAKTQYTTETPARLAAFLDDIDAPPAGLGVALDVGHATASGIAPAAFVDRLSHPIEVCHLHDNDGIHDDHDPLPAYESVAAEVGATYNVLEMKSKADIRRCVEG
jgi:sugar phosphate isomerase/epimerase